MVTFLCYGMSVKQISPVLTSGEGKQVGTSFPSGRLRRALPRMEVMWWAMSFCCSTEQWFSKDRITGYWDVWQERKTWQHWWNEIISNYPCSGQVWARTTPRLIPWGWVTVFILLELSVESNQKKKDPLYLVDQQPSSLLTLKAYSLIALMTSLKSTLDVSVWPW